MLSKFMTRPGTPVPAHWNSPVSALSFGVYLIWAVVAYAPARFWLQGRLDDSFAVHAGLAGLAAFPLLFVLRGLLYQRGSLGLCRIPLLLQVPAVLASCAAFNDGLQPVLLVPVLAQIYMAHQLPAAAVLIAIADTVLAYIMLNQPAFTDDTPSHGILLIAQLGFQAFALLNISFSRRAEEAREEAVRINAELMATRRLLDEGARADERLRLARELHDVAGHKLTALKLQLALQTRQQPALEDCSRLADELLTDIRGVVATLRGHEGVDLQGALRALDRGLPRPALSFELDPALRVADIRSAEALLRCAQEALTNTLRHAAASRVQIRLQAAAAGGLVLVVEDDGAGRVAGLREGMGLRGMRERLQEIGGWMELHDVSPRGIEVRALLPNAAAC